MIAQLFAKRLSPDSVDVFLACEPDHVGWIVKLPAGSVRSLDRAQFAPHAKLAHILRDRGVKSCPVIHPFTDEQLVYDALSLVGPDIVICSSDRDERTVERLAQRRDSHGVQLMIPIGIPVVQLDGYDPLAELSRMSAYADYIITDTITRSGSPVSFGCSGIASNREVVAEVVRRSVRPVIVAGGVTAEEISALGRLEPAGFDAHTAVTTDGIPDLEKSRRFVQSVRALS